MTPTRRRFTGLLAVLALAGLPVFAAHAAEPPAEIRIDHATYNPVSLVLREQRLLEKEFAADGIAVRWVQSLGSNKALEFLNAGSLDFGSTAGGAALLGRDQRQPDPDESTSIRSRSGRRWSPAPTLARHGRRPEGQAHRGDPRHRPAHLPAARARRAPGSPRSRRAAGAAAARRRPHRTAARRRRRLGRARSADGRRRARAAARALLTATPPPTPGGVLNVREAFAAEHPEWSPACSPSMSRAATGRWPTRRALRDRSRAKPACRRRSSRASSSAPGWTPARWMRACSAQASPPPARPCSAPA